MKIIQLHSSDKKLIKLACANDRNAQRKLYERYASKMNALCRCYIKDTHSAEDVMVMAFCKAFSKLSTYSYSGSFEGWLRKIMVNECLSFFRRKKTVAIVDSYDVVLEKRIVDDESLAQEYDVNDILAVINTLPEGYRVVFLLYAIEEYTHKEIANTLSISEGTSKSQLFKARKLLQEKLKDLKNNRYATK